MKVAVIVSTYNQERMLALSLASLKHQSLFETDDSFEVFIADDGSNEKTKAVIDRYRDVLNVPVHHHWHEDQGFRKSRINNDVFRTLRTRQNEFPVTVCFDSDTICHHRFIEDHLWAHRQFPGEKMVFMGRRVDLGEDLSERLTENEIARFQRGLTIPLLTSSLRGGTRNPWRAIHTRSALLRKILRKDRVTDLLGSNFSFSTPLIFEVNGYNENFTTYWGEDGDLFVRFRNTGARLWGSKAFALQFHLMHPRREGSAQAREEYARMLANRNYFRCENGIDKTQSLSDQKRDQKERQVETEMK